MRLAAKAVGALVVNCGLPRSHAFPHPAFVNLAGSPVRRATGRSPFPHTLAITARGGLLRGALPQSSSPRSDSHQRECASSRQSALRATSVLLHDEPTYFGGRQPFTSHAIRWLITRRILSRAKASLGLRVEVEARSDRAALGGRFDTVAVEFEELIFDGIQVTGGAKFEILGVELLTAGLLPGPMRRLRRLRRPCEVLGTFIFTDADLMFSPAVRRLAERVINAALRPRRHRRGRSRAKGPGYDADEREVEESVHVFRVGLRNNKLAIEGEMLRGPFFRVPFRYDTAVSMSRDGHVLYFREPSMYWGTPGGHVPLPMLPLQAFNVDLGDRARIEQLRISRGTLTIGGRFIMSPVVPLTVSRGFKRANVQHDLAESLSRIISNMLQLKRG